MNNKLLLFLSALGISVVSIVIQSVIFPIFFINDYMPDISLIALIYFSINYGKVFGQWLGFSTGIIFDSLSGVPFGLNTLVRLILGFFLGFFEGKIFMDKIILPCIIITLCTVAKFFLISLVGLFYPIDLNIDFFSVRYVIEIGMNILFTPIIFILFNFISKRLISNRDRV
ncbi:rod shape-determining protein MreD [Thiospirochaeta perfilievii]|uniref:Rod shape-determining protein MreD n=1 Tax=Thiospirochaeta perfilievii TaxID=252967 RepID=A0A5C1QET6_9SPIO|nr:rod shape-determining protein MreD [Thiospirochaeta perfilievii]QEN05898.1 rod shape-determining protein MreD [Thiospirochaeta perfilievii]